MIKTAFTLDLPFTLSTGAEEAIRAKGVRWLDVAAGRIDHSEIEIRNITAAPGGTVKGVAAIVDDVAGPGATDKSTSLNGETGKDN